MAATWISRGVRRIGADDPDDLDGGIGLEQRLAHGRAQPCEICGAGGNQHSAWLSAATERALARIDNGRPNECVRGSPEKCGRTLRAEGLATGCGIDREVAVGRKAKVVDHGQRRALPEPALERNVEDVSVEDDDVETRRSVDGVLDALWRLAARVEDGVTTGSDPLVKRQIILRDEHRDLEVRAQRVREREHPLEVPESDAAAAVCGEQRTGGHEVTARAAAHAWIRCSARTTSS